MAECGPWCATSDHEPLSLSINVKVVSLNVSAAVHVEDVYYTKKFLRTCVCAIHVEAVSNDDCAVKVVRTKAISTDVIRHVRTAYFHLEVFTCKFNPLVRFTQK
ncbi:hypothetical protein DPMN_039036 [Dreissena polymorpha]|uniref:Uncharacterized protein n=1 Tax=Dreissena polymorpha TaxID=45954 RepID=A0A9D4RR96_DREPO|nr:hypothetical protein DPMN_039036 [Dreissena polymorpha]